MFQKNLVYKDMILQIPQFYPAFQGVLLKSTDFCLTSVIRF